MEDTNFQAPHMMDAGNNFTTVTFPEYGKRQMNLRRYKINTTSTQSSFGMNELGLRAAFPILVGIS